MWLSPFLVGTIRARGKVQSARGPRKTMHLHRLRFVMASAVDTDYCALDTRCFCVVLYGKALSEQCHPCTMHHVQSQRTTPILTGQRRVTQAPLYSSDGSGILITCPTSSTAPAGSPLSC